MTIFEMLEQSGVLTLLGMGVVVSFLFILVIAVTVVGKVIHAFGLDRDTAPAASRAAPGKAPEEAVTAAITAAVTEYRAGR
ncbi:MAG: OadG family protein [Spirochaetaceae bacterium]|jgi:oxaloacetate decarboxylase gamma subunit|nr:OadG family protein [Spirochaetaceae bacterium]